MKFSTGLSSYFLSHGYSGPLGRFFSLRAWEKYWLSLTDPHTRQLTLNHDSLLVNWFRINKLIIKDLSGHLPEWHQHFEKSIAVIAKTKDKWDIRVYFVSFISLYIQWWYFAWTYANTRLHSHCALTQQTNRFLISLYTPWCLLGIFCMYTILIVFAST